MSAGLTSYQRRKQEIAYLEQCIKELEVLIDRIKQANPGLRVPLLLGSSGDAFLTPYNTGMLP